MHTTGKGWNKRRLRRLLGLFFIALIIPTGILAWQAYSRLKWESFHRYQLLAEELVGRIDQRLETLIDKEEARSFADFSFLVVEGAPAANYLQRSPLANFPVTSDLPGLLGYFQIDAQGRFTTPLLPDETVLPPLAYGISDSELQQRRALREQLLGILSRQRLVTATSSDRPAESPSLEPAAPMAAGERRLAKAESAAPSASSFSDQDAPEAAMEEQLTQAVFDQLDEQPARQRREKKQTSLGSIGRLDDLKLERPFIEQKSKLAALEKSGRKDRMMQQRSVRKELSVLPSPAGKPAPSLAAVAESEQDQAKTSVPKVSIFESEIDPFEFGLLESGHFVLYRKVWRNGQRTIQGALIERQALLQALIEQPFRGTALSAMSRLAIAFGGDILSALGGAQSNRYLISAEQLSGSLLYRARVSAPLSQMELVFTITHMPSGPGGALVIWVALILTLILSGGLYLIYRLGAKQIELNAQQRDFVSAISHELKTPLTSIRMYSEMLREGWAGEERKRTYYDFIHEESERLSRLINNVLQLARLSRNELPVAPHAMPVARLLDMIRSKVSSQIERAGFELEISGPPNAAALSVEVDEDAFIQILINLSDNALKFSAKAERKRIEIGCCTQSDGWLQFSVRDFGPGIPKNQMKKIFLLFYRTESELTRETVGTGIGLALVHRLASAMNGKVDVVSRKPGAEFRLSFPV